MNQKLTLRKALEDFSSAAISFGHSERTTYLYTRDISSFVGRVGGDVKVEDVTLDDIYGWIDSSESVSAKRRKFFAISAFFRTVNVPNPLDGYSWPVQSTWGTPPIPHADVHVLLTSHLEIDTTFYAGMAGGKREQVIANLAYSLFSTGEMADILVSDINFDTGVITFSGRACALAKSAMLSIEQWLKVRPQLGPQPALITTIYGTRAGRELIEVGLVGYSDAMVGKPYSLLNYWASRYRDDLIYTQDIDKLAAFWHRSTTFVKDMHKFLLTEGYL